MGPYTKEDMAHPGFKYIWISGYAIGFVLLCLLCGIWAISPDKPSSSAEPTTNYVRGVRMLAFESPAQAARRDLIVIWTDRKATRQFVPSEEASNSPRSQQPLSQEQWQAILALRSAWCRKPPRNSAEPFYDLRIECGLRQPRHILLPADSLPPALATLLEAVPLPE